MLHQLNWLQLSKYLTGAAAAAATYSSVLPSHAPPGRWDTWEYLGKTMTPPQLELEKPHPDEHLCEPVAGLGCIPAVYQ